MGKQKRARQKYHIASVNGRLNNDDTKSESGRSSVSMKSVSLSRNKLKISPDENLFKNIEIDVDNLRKLNNPEDDRKSVKSISKSIKRSIAESGSNIHLKKKDKRELRRQLFINKMEAVQTLLHTNNSKRNNKDTVSSGAELTELPEENMLFFKSEFKQPKGPRPVSSKKKPIAKAKKRKQDLLSNVDAFKKVIADQASLSDSFGAATEAIQKMVFNEAT